MIILKTLDDEEFLLVARIVLLWRPFGMSDSDVWQTDSHARGAANAEELLISELEIMPIKAYLLF